MEKINHPEHYKGNKYEAIDIIDDYQLGFNLGNAVKYILRAGKKGDTAEDLKKAKWYIEHEICKLMNEQRRRKKKTAIFTLAISATSALKANASFSRGKTGKTIRHYLRKLLVVRGRRKNEIPYRRKHNDKQSKRTDGNCT